MKNPTCPNAQMLKPDPQEFWTLRKTRPDPKPNPRVPKLLPETPSTKPEMMRYEKPDPNAQIRPEKSLPLVEIRKAIPITYLL